MYNITDNNSNKDIPNGNSPKDIRQACINYYDDFKSSLPDPEFYPSPERDDIFILDFAKGPCGLKAYGAEKYIAELDNNLLGYAAPRVGHAPEAIAVLAEKYNKKAVFFAAASKQVTEHQSVVLAHKNCDLRFVKIPAMPTLNAWIRKWADKFNGVALPFGLSNTFEVTAGLVNTFVNHSKKHGIPTETYCAVSTGTMIRSLQIAFPNSKHIGVAVARNIKEGEKGLAEITSYHKKFYSDSDYIPSFNTTSTYDAKAYKKFIDCAKLGSIFINVGSDSQIKYKLQKVPNWQNIDSQREWGNQEAFSYA